MKSEEEVYDLFEAYLNNELSSTDMEAFEAKIQSDPLVAGSLAEYLEIMKAAQLSKKEHLMELYRRESPILNHGFLVAIAATAASFLIFLIFWIGLSPNDTIYQTSFGEIKTIVLPDRSVVTLNANTTLKVLKKRNTSSSLDLSLKGEAYFEVLRKEQNQGAFRIFVDKLVVEVVGTSFNICNRDSKTEIYLVEGALMCKIPESENNIMLKPSELLVYSSMPGQEPTILLRETQTAFLEWKNGFLIFKNETSHYIFQKLEEIYGVKFDFSDVDSLNLNKRKFTMTVPIDDLETALVALEELHSPMKFSKKGNVITIQE